MPENKSSLQGLPYLPEGREILYVEANHPLMKKAKDVALSESLDPAHPTGAVVVRVNQILGQGANGSPYHEQHGCERKKQNIPTGQGYELCEGCHPKNHAEQKAIANTKKNGNSPENADLYLWGHWWCCQSCWEVMMKNKIRNVYLPLNAQDLFQKK